jgi:hypothetical protein
LGAFPEACFGFVIPAKANQRRSLAGIQKKKDWMPDQVRHDEIRPIPRSLLRGSSFVFEVFSLLNHDACIGMPEVMKSHPRKPCILQRGEEMTLGTLF